MGFAGRGDGPLIKSDLIDLDHDVGKRLTFGMPSLDLLPADPASVELTTKHLEI